MATLNDIGLAEPSTLTKRLAAAEIQRNSTNQYQELMCLADPDSTTALAIAKVTNLIPQSTAWGLSVREARPVLNTLVSTAGTDSAVTLISSGAADRAYVSAFTVTSTVAGPVFCGFYAGATLRWPLTMWADGGAVNVSESIAAPGYLFAGSVGEPLTFQVASTGAFRVAITYSTGV